MRIEASNNAVFALPSYSSKDTHEERFIFASISNSAGFHAPQPIGQPTDRPGHSDQADPRSSRRELGWPQRPKSRARGHVLRLIPAPLHKACNPAQPHSQSLRPLPLCGPRQASASEGHEAQDTDITIIFVKYSADRATSSLKIAIRLDCTPNSTYTNKYHR